MQLELLPDRVLAKIAFEPNTGCWLWTGARNNKGYGIIRLARQRKSRVAHALVHELLKGPIQGGCQHDHLCRMKCCVNPDHLEAVPQFVNQRRTPFSSGNEFMCKRGHNRPPVPGPCRECAKLHTANYRRRKAVS